MPLITIPPDAATQQKMLYIIGTALLAGVAHIGRLLYENKPVPLRQAVGGSMLTLCVGGASGAMCVSYWQFPGPVVASGAIVVGFIGGPFILALLGKVGERGITRKVEQVAEALEGEGEGDK